MIDHFSKKEQRLLRIHEFVFDYGPEFDRRIFMRLEIKIKISKDMSYLIIQVHISTQQREILSLKSHMKMKMMAEMNR